MTRCLLRVAVIAYALTFLLLFGFATGVLAQPAATVLPLTSLSGEPAGRLILTGRDHRQALLERPDGRTAKVRLVAQRPLFDPAGAHLITLVPHDAHQFDVPLTVLVRASSRR
ncbi:MAG: hypothetical protein ACFB22_06910 [Rhodothalassiaceae bacterium]